jgi:transcriptional regulator with XRE-family HTH domain
MPEMAGIARRFTDRRLALRLTQQGLADLAGVTRYSVQSLERGDSSLKFASVLQIAVALGLHLHASAASE